MEVRSKLRTSVLWSGLGKYAQFGIALLGQIFLIKLLSPADFGAYTLVLSATGLLFFLSAFNIPLSIIFLHNGDEALDIVVPAILVTVGVTWSISAAVYPFLQKGWGVDGWIVVTLMAAQSLELLLAVYWSYMRKRFMFSVMAVIQLMASVLSLVLGIGLAHAGYGAMSLAWKALAQPGISLLLSRLVIGTPFGFSWSFRRIHRLYLDCSFMFAAQLLENLYARIDRIMLGFLSITRLVGLYDRGLYVTQVMNSSLSPIVLDVGFPAFASVRGHLEQQKKLLGQALTVLMVLCGLFFIVLVTSIPYLERWIFKVDKWPGISTAILFSAPLVLLIPVFELMKSLLYSTDQQKFVAIVRGIQIGTLLIALIPLFFTQGIVGAILALILSQAVGTALVAYRCSQLFEFQVTRFLLRGFATAVIPALTQAVIPGGSLGKVVLGVSTYTVLIATVWYRDITGLIKNRSARRTLGGSK